MNRIKDAITKVSEGKTYDELSNISGFKHRANFSTSVNRESIKLRRFIRLCDKLGYKIVLTKGRKKVEL